jgi:hypothetical protein
MPGPSLHPFQHRGQSTWIAFAEALKCASKFQGGGDILEQSRKLLEERVLRRCVGNLVAYGAVGEGKRLCSDVGVRGLADSEFPLEELQLLGKLEDFRPGREKRSNRPSGTCWANTMDVARSKADIKRPTNDISSPPVRHAKF